MSKQTKIIIGSEYTPNEYTVGDWKHIQKIPKHIDSVDKNNQRKFKIIANRQFKPTPKIDPTVSSTYLRFKNENNLPYIYIIDFASKKISSPILATPLYQCSECNTDESLYYRDGKITCRQCGSESEIVTHIFFDTNILYYSRVGGQINTNLDEKTGIPTNWLFHYKRNTVAYTYNDEQRVYDSNFIMVDCNEDILNYYSQLASLSSKRLNLKDKCKFIIYRNFVLPLMKHHGVGLENKDGKWLLTTIEDEMQFMTTIMPLYKFPDSFVDIEHIDENYIEFMTGEYLDLIGGSF